MISKNMEHVGPPPPFNWDSSSPISPLGSNIPTPPEIEIEKRRRTLELIVNGLYSVTDIASQEWRILLSIRKTLWDVSANNPNATKDLDKIQNRLSQMGYDILDPKTLQKSIEGNLKDYNADPFRKRLIDVSEQLKNGQITPNEALDRMYQICIADWPK